MDAKLLRIANKFEGRIVEKSKVATVADKFMRKLAQEAQLAPPFQFPKTEEEERLQPWELENAPEEASKPWSQSKPVVIPEVTVEGDPNPPAGSGTGTSIPKPEPKPFNWNPPKPAGAQKPPAASLAPPFQFPKTEEEEKLEPWLVKTQSMQKRVNSFLKLAK